MQKKQSHPLLLSWDVTLQRILQFDKPRTYGSKCSWPIWFSENQDFDRYRACSCTNVVFHFRLFNNKLKRKIKKLKSTILGSFWDHFRARQNGANIPKIELVCNDRNVDHCSPSDRNHLASFLPDSRNPKFF